MGASLVAVCRVLLLQSLGSPFAIVISAIPVMGNLSFLSRDGTHTPCTGRQTLNHCTTRGVPDPSYFDENANASSLLFTLLTFALMV